jgi:hypothetical protein
MEGFVYQFLSAPPESRWLEVAAVIVQVAIAAAAVFMPLHVLRAQRLERVRKERSHRLAMMQVIKSEVFHINLEAGYVSDFLQGLRKKPLQPDRNPPPASESPEPKFTNPVKKQGHKIFIEVPVLLGKPEAWATLIGSDGSKKLADLSRHIRVWQQFWKELDDWPGLRQVPETVFSSIELEVKNIRSHAQLSLDFLEDELRAG